MGVQMQIASLFMGFMAAQQARKAHELEAQSYREQADMAKIEAGQKEIERNRKLRIQLAALGTSMSAQGVALGTSQSVSALATDETRIAKQDVDTIRLMGQSERRKFALSAAGSDAAASAATMGGFAKTLGGLYSIDKGVG